MPEMNFSRQCKEFLSALYLTSVKRLFSAYFDNYLNYYQLIIPLVYKLVRCRIIITKADAQKGLLCQAASLRAETAAIRI